MKIMFTIVGINHYFDSDEWDANQEIVLRKEIKNKIDAEAIVVYTNALKKISYITNSVHTKSKGTYSVGRLYGKIGSDTIANTLIVFFTIQ